MSMLTRLRERFPVLGPASKAEARVAIAEDVILRLKYKGLVATRGTYFILSEWAQGADESFEVVALSTRGRGKTQCEVCAIGAACVAAVGLYDKAPSLEKEWNPEGGDELSAHTMRTVLSRWFTRKQLDLIECAFECSTGFDGGGSSFDNRLTAQVFGTEYRGEQDSRDRLEAIMQNIIENNGTFKP